MKRISAALVLALFLLLGLFLLGAGSSGSGLRGTVLIDPGSPTCQPGTTCARPAPNVLLRFWRSGKVVAHTRTDSKGQFRIALRAHTYRVTTRSEGTLTPTRVSVAAGRYRRVTFRLDIGIR